MSEITPVDTPNPADRLLEACPFLDEHRTEYWECGPTIVFGDVARLLRKRELTDGQARAVFDYLNALAETGDDLALGMLATGALEKFNDDAASQRLARAHLRGKALAMLEEMRIFWGQPDYGGSGPR